MSIDEIGRGEKDEMSRCEKHAGTFNRAGFYLPFFGQNSFPDQEAFMQMAAQYDFVPLFARFKIEGCSPDAGKKSAPLAMARLFEAMKPGARPVSWKA